MHSVLNEFAQTPVQLPSHLQLVANATEGLNSMFDRNTQLFCYRLRLRDGLVVKEGLSQRYSAMTALGLKRLSESGKLPPMNPTQILEQLLTNAAWLNNCGDIGLLMWACALIAPDQLANLEQVIDPARLSDYHDVRQGRTMELSWLLSGLTHLASVTPDRFCHFESITKATFKALAANQGPSGVFGHMSLTTLAGKLRARIGSFADQVYPIYALSKFAQVFGDSDAADRALRCARAICTLQGGLGQWWWHYDSRTGEVVERYPVYSVHQHGMAPMALLAASEISDTNFMPWIDRGLRWIGGFNELAVNMQDQTHHLVWRNIHPSGIQSHLTLSLRFALRQVAGRSFRVLYECRPYELGWLLYAFAGQNSC